MTAEQRREQPKQGEVGRLAASLSNVTILDQNSTELDYFKWGVRNAQCGMGVGNREIREGREKATGGGLLQKVAKETKKAEGENRLGLVFIDGDHSYAGVRTDTEKALEYFAATPRQRKERRFIVWHDVSESHPKWVGVLDYLSKEVAPYYDVKRVKDSCLAYLEV